ncbi:MAG: flagellar filament capping protein FliD, partial [Oscillospiraceae bacterium]|nr:flagellar filament capping protein FliD [Oscillospiraceae bacterium]
LASTDESLFVELEQFASTADVDDLYTALGLTGTAVSNYAPGGGTKLSEFAAFDGTGALTFNVGGELGVSGDATVSLNDPDMTISDLIEKVNAAAGKNIMSFENGKVTIDSGNETLAFKETGNSDVLKTLFGRSTYETAKASTDFQTRLDAGMGQNAEIVVNGQTLYETSNTFTVNGTNITVNALHNKDYDPTDPASPKPDAAVSVTVNSNPDDVVDKLKGFIEEYNALVDVLDGVVKEQTVDGYAPLTDEQRAEMTEDQIKQWENEAKKGLLYNDSTIRGIMQQMRSALYSSVKAAGISLYDIGITTESFSSSSSFKGNGRLEMSESGETKLREMLTNNPDAVRTLFADPNEGLAVKLDNIINDAIRTSSTSQGTLVALAGHADSVSNTYSIGRKIEDIDEQITRLQTRLENEYSRYWQKFANLETAISNMNSQSSYLSSMGS